MIRASTLCLTSLLLFAACGPTQPVKCTMANCSGCCSESGECLGAMTQSNMACGTGGGECRSCLPGQLCASGRCEKDPNAVIEIDGGMMTVDAGRPDSGMTTCGSLNTPCCTNNTCYLGLSCLRGTCQMAAPDAGSCGGLGEPCCMGTMCSASGTSCSSGLCQSVPDAGPGDAGVQLKATGEACTADAQCIDGACLTNRFDSGYCTKGCTSSGDCFAGSQCGSNPSGVGPSRICLKQCSSPNTSPGGCRTSYVCEPNAGTSGAPVCYPACTSSTQCGTAPTCDSRGFCCGATGFACCEGNSCAVGNSCMSGTCRATGGTGGGTGSTGGGSGSTGGGTGAGGGSGTTGGGAGSTGGGTATGNNRAHGSACTDFLQCSGNSCITNWPGGYCSSGNCSGSSCGSAASCTTYLNPTRCLQNCTWNGGAGDCRAGYVCDRRLIASNPSQAVCYPACTSGAGCETGVCENGFCCGGAGYRCCAGTTPCATGSCQSDGYCG